MSACTNSHCMGDSCPNEACDCDCHKTAHPITALSAAEDCIHRTIGHWWGSDDPRPPMFIAIADALRADNDALADLDSVWRGMDESNLNVLMHALEREKVKAEQLRRDADSAALELRELRRQFAQRDEAETYVHPDHPSIMARMMRFQVRAGPVTGYMRCDDAAWEAERIRDEALAAGIAPLTVDIDGRVWRVEQTDRTEIAWTRGKDPDPWDRPLYRLVPADDQYGPGPDA